MTINLQTFANGDTDYIDKHNTNASTVQSAVNLLENDVSALKAASGAGADLDFRQNAFNLLVNGGFDYWQRGTTTRPDAWVIRNDGAGFTVERESSTIKLNTYAAKLSAVGQIAQDLPDETRLAVDNSQFAFGVYAKTDTADKARIGYYNGVTTTYSNYHTGSDEWEWLTLSLSVTSAPSAMRFVLDSQGGTVYFASAVVIRGNPNSGPTFVANDPTLERLRVFSLYEIGETSVRGVGYLNSGDRELESRIEFCAPKRAVPTVTIDEELTGYDFSATNISREGFNLIVSETGGSSGTDGFEYDDISWTAEVSGT